METITPRLTSRCGLFGVLIELAHTRDDNVWVVYHTSWSGRIGMAPGALYLASVRPNSARNFCLMKFNTLFRLLRTYIDPAYELRDHVLIWI